MYNLRYHVASLVAVFIALAVGLVLGTVVAERGMLDDQGVALVQGLQTRFDEIAAENEQLTIGLERDRAFAEAAVAPLTEGRLSGVNVALLASAGADAGVPAVRSAIESAGGSSVVMTLSSPALGLDESEPEGLAGYLHGRGIEIASPGQALREQMARELVTEWRAGAELPMTEFLVSSGLLATESVAGTATIDAIVIVGTGAEGCDALALTVADQMMEAGGRAAGVDSAPVPGGTAALCADAGVSAVDHLATPQGRFSLVYILAGQATGYFGSGEGANGFFPPVTR